MSLMTKLKKISTIKGADSLDKSSVYNEKDMVSTDVPAINIALAGSLNGGLTPGLLQIAGPSKHFKSAFCLLIASAYLKKYQDAVILFYDSEFGTPESYFTSFGIPKDRVMHTPITDIEEFKHDIMTQLNGIDKGDKVCIVVDSIGNLASKKETDDALSGNSAADMTRAKTLKSLGRLITPHLTLKDIPMIIVNHTYKTMELYAKDVVGGGQGLYLSSDNIWIVGRRQDKEKGENDIKGYDFIINIEKSRHVREKTKIPISVSYEGGINKWSGLFDIALKGKFIELATQGWYVAPGYEKNVRRSDIEYSSEFWNKMIKDSKFDDYIKGVYRFGTIMMAEDE
jgi:RecA/RadA recombinase